MFHQTSRAGVPFFTFQELERIPGLVHVFTSRQTDVFRDAIEGRQVGEEKSRLLGALHLRRESLVFLEQVHSNRVLEQDCDADVPATDLERGPADGVILTSPGCYAVIRTADCLPIVAVIPARRMVCCLHAGWRGTLDHIAHRGLDRLLSLSGGSPSEAVVALGPCVRRCCYEVGEEVRERFSEAGHKIDEVFEGRMLDLVKANLADLKGLGVERVLDSEMCTVCRADLFYSHRLNRDRCRMWTIAGFRQ